jgi:hypothetical protein
MRRCRVSHRERGAASQVRGARKSGQLAPSSWVTRAKHRVHLFVLACVFMCLAMLSVILVGLGTSPLKTNTTRGIALESLMNLAEPFSPTGRLLPDL